jgi:glycerophosphoryl diester phosphodiesterase
MKPTMTSIGITICMMVLTACSQSLPGTKEKTDMETSPPLIIAHRGARSLAPENTLASARKALQVGADLWELDVAVTADGELVLMHDDTLERTCNVTQVYPDRAPWNVWDFTLAEIQTLDCGSWFNQQDPFSQIEGGYVSQDDQQSYVGELAPTLQEALEFTRDNNWRVNIELKKQPTPEFDHIIVEDTVELVESLGMDTGGQVVISSFHHDYLRNVKELNPAIPTQAVTSKVISDLPAYLADLGADAVNPKVTTWNYKSITKLQNQGVAFNVWTVNDELEMKALINTGVQGIITDFPQLLKQVLHE